MIHIGDPLSAYLSFAPEEISETTPVKIQIHDYKEGVDMFHPEARNYFTVEEVPQSNIHVVKAVHSPETVYKTIYGFIEKAKWLEQNKELVGTIPITGILKKGTDSNNSFSLQGYDVDDICPPWWPHRYPPHPNVSYTNPLPWIQKIIQIDVKDVVKQEMLDRTKDGENIVREYLNKQSVARIRFGI